MCFLLARVVYQWVVDASSICSYVYTMFVPLLEERYQWQTRYCLEFLVTFFILVSTVLFVFETVTWITLGNTASIYLTILSCWAVNVFRPNSWSAFRPVDFQLGIFLHLNLITHLGYFQILLLVSSIILIA